MDKPKTGDITIVLRAVSQGHPGAVDDLMRMVYGELRRIAGNRLPNGPCAGGIQPTELINEAYIRLFGDGPQEWENRHHFFWAAARAMRDIMVERARRNATLKRGGDRAVYSLQTEDSVISESEDLLALDEAMQRFEEVYPSIARMVMLRFYGGLTREEAAEVLGISSATLGRDWAFARAWLRSRLGGASCDGV